MAPVTSTVRGGVTSPSAATALLSAGDGLLAPLRGYVAILLLLMLVGAALYLASDASRFTNGAIIKVDGGAAYGS